MLGVVLWSDASDRKAVIWCEDQGDLAFLSSPGDVLAPEEFFDAGDLVQFDMEELESLRRAHNPKLLLEQAAAQLPEALKIRGERLQDSDSTGNVIPFSRPQSQPRYPDRRMTGY